MKLTIYDVTLTPREVEVPEACPKCGGPLGKLGAGEETALVAWDLNDRGYLSQLKTDPQAPAEDEPAPFLDVIDEVKNSPGEQFHGPIALWCSCGQWNEEGTVEVLDNPEGY